MGELRRFSLKTLPALAFAAFEDYRMGGVTLSSKAIAVVKRMLAGEAAVGAVAVADQQVHSADKILRPL